MTEKSRHFLFTDFLDPAFFIFAPFFTGHLQKHCVVANVNVDGKHLTQIKKRNIQQRLSIIHCGNSVSLAGEEWGENEKDWVEKVGEKKMAAVFSYDLARGSR